MWHQCSKFWGCQDYLPEVVSARVNEARCPIWRGVPIFLARVNEVIDKSGKIRQLRWKVICLKLINEDIVSQSFEILLTFAYGGGANFHKLAGLHLRSLKTHSFQNWQAKFTNIKALFQVMSVDFPFTWSRSTGRGRVSTLSVPGFHMQGHCNIRKIYSYFEKNCARDNPER